MIEGFRLTEMKIDGGYWKVKFTAPTNDCGLGPLTVSVDKEEFIPEKGRHVFTPEEVITKAHRTLANEMQRAFKAAVISIPRVDWETARSLTVSEFLAKLGLDDA